MTNFRSLGPEQIHLHVPSLDHKLTAANGFHVGKRTVKVSRVNEVYNIIEISWTSVKGE